MCTFQQPTTLLCIMHLTVVIQFYTTVYDTWSLTLQQMAVPSYSFVFRLHEDNSQKSSFTHRPQQNNSAHRNTSKLTNLRVYVLQCVNNRISPVTFPISLPKPSLTPFPSLYNSKEPSVYCFFIASKFVTVSVLQLCYVDYLRVQGFYRPETQRASCSVGGVDLRLILYIRESLSFSSKKA